MDRASSKLLRFVRRQGVILPALWGVAATLLVALPLLVARSDRGPTPDQGRLVPTALDLASSENLDAGDCVSCHRFETAFSHPVGVRPHASVPESLPLDQGRMTCLTCHDPQALEGHTTRAPRGEPGIRGSMPVPSLCAQCHDATASDAKGAHAAGLNIAHLHPGSRRAGSTSRTGALDTESRTCMTCHDGSSAADAGMHAVRSSRFSPERDHPIGIPYKSRRATAQSDEIRLVESHALDTRIRLFDGQVGCGSCHSVYSRQKDLVVMPMLRSQLCLGCHVE